MYTKYLHMDKKPWIIFLLLLPMQKNLFSQNSFSQFYSSPLTINPANTGRFDGGYRVGGIYRNEKSSAGLMSQGSFFYDTRILRNVIPEKDKIAIGVLMMFEKNEIDGILKKNNLALSLAYHKALNEEGSQQISVGFQLGLSHQSLDFPPYIFEDQIASWARSGYTGFQFSQSKNINFSYPDLNIGVGYQSPLNSDNRVNIGISVLHVNSPYRSFNGGEFKLTPVGSLQLEWDRKLDSKQNFYSSFLMDYTKQDKLNNLFMNIFFKTRIQETGYKIGIGASYRKSAIKGDAIIACAALHYSGFALNAAYDINISNKATSQRGALEMTIIYTGQRRSK